MSKSFRGICFWLLMSFIGHAISAQAPRQPIQLSAEEMAKLRAAIPLPRPDTKYSIRELYVIDYPDHRDIPRAEFETEPIETGPDYRRARVGSCTSKSGSWTCYHRDLVTYQSGIAVAMHAEMSTQEAVPIWQFAASHALRYSSFSIEPPIGNEIELHVFHGGCVRAMHIRKTATGFELVKPDWAATAGMACS
jgi:hypothetical protein